MRFEPLVLSFLAQKRRNELVFESFDCHTNASSNVRLREIGWLSHVKYDEVAHVLQHIEDVLSGRDLQGEGLGGTVALLRHHGAEVDCR